MSTLLQDLIRRLRFCGDLKLQRLDFLGFSLVVVYHIVVRVKGKTVTLAFSQTVVERLIPIIPGPRSGLLV